MLLLVPATLATISLTEALNVKLVLTTAALPFTVTLDADVAGCFHCSSELLNEIYNNCFEMQEKDILSRFRPFGRYGPSLP